MRTSTILMFLLAGYSITCGAFSAGEPVSSSYWTMSFAVGLFFWLTIYVTTLKLEEQEDLVESLFQNFEENFENIFEVEDRE